MATQASADALVRDVLQRTRDLRLAIGLTSGAQTGSSNPGPSLAVLTRRHALAVSDYTSTLCSAGQASVDIPDAVLNRFTANPTTAQLAVGDTVALVSKNCVVKAAVELGAVSLGDFGVGDTTSGRFELKLAKLAGSDVVFELTYTAFTYKPFGGLAFEPLDALARFGTDGGVAVYSLDIPGTRFLAAPAVTTAQNQVFVSLGRLRGQLPVASGSGFVDYEYRAWDFNSSTLHATVGTVGVTGTGTGTTGTSARVIAGASSYSVEITAGGRTQLFTVNR